VMQVMVDDEMMCHGANINARSSVHNPQRSLT